MENENKGPTSSTTDKEKVVDDEPELKKILRWAANGAKVGAAVAGLVAPIILVIIAGEWLRPRGK